VLGGQGLRHALNTFSTPSDEDELEDSIGKLEFEVAKQDFAIVHFLIVLRQTRVSLRDHLQFVGLGHITKHRPEEHANIKSNMDFLILFWYFWLMEENESHFYSANFLSK